MLLQLKLYKYAQRLLFTTVIADLAILNHAVATAYPSPAEDRLKFLNILDDTTFPIFSSLHFFAAAFGSILIAPFNPILGRKANLMILAFINGVAWMLIVAGGNVYMLFTGRIIIGLVNGATTAIVPLYISELTPKKWRGFFGSFIFMFLMLGFILVYSLGSILDFRKLALVPMSISLLQLILLFNLPYSPTWLISRGLKDESYRVLKMFRSEDDNALEEIKQLHKLVEETKTKVSSKLKQFWIMDHYIKALLVSALYTTLSQLFTGTTVIGSYAANSIGPNKLLDPQIAAIFPFVFGLLGSIISSLLTDRVGRRC